MTVSYAGGGRFLLHAAPEHPVLKRSDLGPQVSQLTDSVDRFLAQRIAPNMRALEAQTPGLLRACLKEAGELGLFLAELPAEYGGLDLPKAAVALLCERLGSWGGFNNATGAHAGLAMTALALHGSEAVKAKYLPHMATGELIGAYCLTEPGSGSDALALKTVAKPSPDGAGWQVSGTKMWISNGGIADVYVVFCQLQTEHGAQLSALLIDRASAGVSTGAEERKMGLHCASTTTVTFQDTFVPRANLLGVVGKGAKIALTILTLGRCKIAAGSAGAIRRALLLATRHACERRAFGQPIADFGAVQALLGRVSAQLFALEGALYRALGEIDRAVASGRAITDVLEESAIEASILKIAGTEIADAAVDAGVQVHGGLGYSAELEVERLYRDNRINRILEGTNEINRNIIVTTYLRRAARGAFPLQSAARDARAALARQVSSQNATALLKRSILVLLDELATCSTEPIASEQEAAHLLADTIIAAYLAESAQLAHGVQAGPANELAKDAASLALGNALRVVQHAAEALASHFGSKAIVAQLPARLAAARREIIVDEIALLRRLASATIAARGYPEPA